MARRTGQRWGMEVALPDGFAPGQPDRRAERKQHQPGRAGRMRSPTAVGDGMQPPDRAGAAVLKTGAELDP